MTMFSRQAHKAAIWVLGVFFAVGVCAQAHGQQIDTLRIMQYNLTNYANASNPNQLCQKTDYKDSLQRIIFSHAKPDILGCNEVRSIAAYAQRIVQLNLNINGTTSYVAAPSRFTNGSTLMNAFFYNSDKVGLKSQNVINSSVRLMDHYRMYVKPQPGADTIFFNVIVAHLKASNTSADEAVRNAMVQTLNTYLATQDTSEGFIFQGDLNVYRSAESGYQSLTNPASGGFFVDPINKPGTWSSNSSFAFYHTQCPSTAQTACAVGGGMDDRFDQQLVTRGMLGAGRKLRYLGSAFRVIGNDGRHYNQDINNGTNNAAPASVINALWSNSDHLPILGKMVVTTPVRNRAQLAKTPHRVWHQPDGLHLAGVDGVARLRVSTLTGVLLHEVDVESASVVPIPSVAGGQWMLVTVVPATQGNLPSQHRVWFSN